MFDKLTLTIEGAAAHAEHNGVSRADFDSALESGALATTWEETGSKNRLNPREELRVRESDLAAWLNRR